MIFFQFQRKNVDSHLQSNMREHLEFACVKLNSTQVQLNEQRVQLDETRVQLDKTQVQLEETQAKLSCLTVEDGGKKRFIWKIKSFSESLRQAKEGVKEMIESDPFYTGCYGYKLKVLARPYYTGLGMKLLPCTPHLSIGIVLMEGEYDDMLPWPFSKKITFTIIDQNKDLKERKNYIGYQLIPRKDTELRSISLAEMIFIRRPRGGRCWTASVKSEIPCFISHDRLQTRHFIANDTLFLQVDVEPYD